VGFNGKEYRWRPSRSKYAPDDTKKIVHLMTMIRSLQHESTVPWLPNELLFLIFEQL